MVSRSPGVGEDADEDLPEVCRRFLDEGFPDNGVAGWATGPVGSEKEHCGECRAGAATVVFRSSRWGNDIANALGEGGGVELGSDDFVRAVGHDGDAPVADEGDELAGLRGLDLGAEMFGLRDAGFSFDIDENEIVVAGREHGESFAMGEGGVDVEA